MGITELIRVLLLVLNFFNYEFCVFLIVIFCILSINLFWKEKICCKNFKEIEREYRFGINKYRYV